MNDEPKTDAEEVELIPDEEGAMPDLQAKIKKLKADLARSDKERKEYLDGWQRAKADGINYKKEEGRRLEDLIRFASVGMIEELLPVLDSFDLALAGSTDKGMERGIMLIRSQLEDV
ncbi:MAG: nucleotide exchange factor GrpE, partial [Candidatus Sungbacteria bacterium]|nr:nucleotide exchange factor GrpE [Candidatus Sungbacteria bacterium]